MATSYPCNSQRKLAEYGQEASKGHVFTIKPIHPYPCKCFLCFPFFSLYCPQVISALNVPQRTCGASSIIEQICSQLDCSPSPEAKGGSNKQSTTLASSRDILRLPGFHRVPTFCIHLWHASYSQTHYGFLLIPNSFPWPFFR